MIDQHSKLCRKYGSLVGAVELALDYLTNPQTYLSKETIIKALERSLEHDGTEAFRLFPELDR